MVVNQDLFDEFSLLHLISGVIAKKAGLSFVTTLLGSAVFELLEIQLKTVGPSLFPHPSQDSSLNMFGDSIAVMVGWLIG